MAKLKLQFSNPDLPLLGVVLALTIFGLIMIYDASVVEALRSFLDRYYFVKLQSIWFIIGMSALFFFYKLDYHHLNFIAPLLLFSSLLTLLLVILPGVATEIYGAKRRIDIGFITLQPAEFAKFVYIVYLARLFSKTEFHKSSQLLMFLLVSALIVGLIFLEPDLGTAFIIVSIGTMLYFLSGAPVKYFLFLVPVSVIVITAFALSAPYRFNRLLAFIDPLRDPQNTSYHINQILIALANGGIFGVGFGQSRQKYEYIPEVATDSIFAVLAEEVGFVGSVVVIAAFLFLVVRGIQIAKSAPDKFGSLLAFGITFWVGIQSTVNLSAMVALLPLTGVPLPFISYGGSALVSTLAAIGVLLNISRQRIKVSSKR